MPGSDRHHVTKRKSEPEYKQQATATTGNVDSRLHQTKSTGSSSSSSSHSSSSKHNKRHKPSKHGSRADSPVEPPVVSIKPLVEYDDISSDSDEFLDPPGPLDEKPQDELYRNKDIRTHKRKRSRKKSKDPHRVRESGDEGDKDGKTKKMVMGDRDGKDIKRKSRDKLASAVGVSRPEGDPGLRRTPAESHSSSIALQLAESSSSVSQKSKSKESHDSSHRSSHRSHRNKTEQEHEREYSDRSRRKASKNRKGASSRTGGGGGGGGVSVSVSSPVDPEDGYSSRRRASTPSPYRDSSRRSRQRSESPYSRRRSSSYDRDTSPYGNRRSCSTSPVSR